MTTNDSLQQSFTVVVLDNLLKTLEILDQRYETGLLTVV